MPENLSQLIINQWQTAIVDSPHVGGFAMMKLADIESFPGALKVQKKTLSLFPATLNVSFTAVAATDICTLVSGVVPDTGTAIQVSTTGTLPAGLSAATTYFIINLSATTFKLATNQTNAFAATAIDITTAGTGTQTITTLPVGTINHIAKDERANIRYFHDSNGRVWYLSNGASRVLLLANNTLSNAAGNGLVVFQNSDSTHTYLLVFRNAVLDIVDVTAASNLQNPTWTSGWQSLNSSAGSGNSHHVIVGQDNIIYFCDDRWVGSIKELTVFDPTSGTTFNYNYRALDFPQGEVAQWLEEQGTNLLTAGRNSNFIYPWDRLSDSYNRPISVPEKSIRRIKNIGDTIYILAGTKGNIYKTLGTSVQLAKKIPDYLMNNTASITANPVTWGGIGARNGALIFGVAGQTAGNNGVYLLFPDGRLIMDNMPSTGSINVTAIQADNDFYYLGYAGGADAFDLSRYTNFETVAQSGLVRVSTKTMKGKFATLEVQIARPTAIGSSIRVSWRRDLTSAFVVLNTFTTDGVNTSFRIDASGMIDLENVQVMVEMSNDAELIEVGLYP